jgi:hypothetical protein
MCAPGSIQFPDNPPVKWYVFIPFKRDSEILQVYFGKILSCMRHRDVVRFSDGPAAVRRWNM